MRRWNKIDTAPKRGVYVILFDPTEDDKIFIGYYRYGRWNPCFSENWVEGAGLSYPSPTHWLPLPEEP